MTDEQIAEIEARATAATPGPWMSFNTDDTYAMNIYGVTTSYELWADEPEKDNGNGNIVALTLLQTPRYACHDSRRFEENAIFIAHARADIPALIAALRAERARVSTLQHSVAVLRDMHAADAKECERLRARVAKLEQAARIDIDAANAECAGRDCKAWISRGGPCDQCPCVTVSSISDALGVALCSVQKVTDYAEAQP